MAYPREPARPHMPPKPPPADGWGYLPFVIAIAVLAAFAYWFFSVDWERQFTGPRGIARPGATPPFDAPGKKQ